MQENNLQKEWNGKRNKFRQNDRKVTENRPFRQNQGRDSVERFKFDENQIKLKIPNEDALARSEYNNKVVDKLEFVSYSGKHIITGNQLLYFTLMPSKPLIDCNYIRLLKTIDIDNIIKTSNGEINKKEVYYIRGCFYNKKEGESPDICNIGNKRIQEHKCVGNKFQTSSIEFWIVTKGTLQIDSNKKEFHIMMINKTSNMFEAIELSNHPDKDKSTCLHNLYNSMKSGLIKISEMPKPGNTLFYTVFSGDTDVEIETITGKTLKGTVRKYELTPGGHPSLNFYDENDKEKLMLIPLYMISTMIITKCNTDDIFSRKAVELTMNGHIVIPHRDNYMIIDYCNRQKLDKDQLIQLDGNVSPFNQLSKHDIEVKKIMLSK